MLIVHNLMDGKTNPVVNLKVVIGLKDISVFLQHHRQSVAMKGK